MKHRRGSKVLTWLPLILPPSESTFSSPSRSITTWGLDSRPCLGVFGDPKPPRPTDPDDRTTSKGGSRIGLRMNEKLSSVSSELVITTINKEDFVAKFFGHWMRTLLIKCHVPVFIYVNRYIQQNAFSNWF